MYISTLIHFFFLNNKGMLLTPFSFIWVLQMLKGYSKFLINIYLGIFVIQLGIFVKVKTLLTNDTFYTLNNIFLTTDFVLRSN